MHHHRQAEPLRVAAQHGIRTGGGIRLDNEIAEAFDTILVHMLWDDGLSNAWEELAAKGDHRLIFDIDDVMWRPDWAPFAQHYTHERMKRVWRNIGLSHVVTTPSPYIAEKVAEYNPNVWIVPNTVPEYLLHLNRPDPPVPLDGHKNFTRFDDGPFGWRRDQPVIGYQGSPSHATDFPGWLMSTLLTFLEQFPSWQLHFWGPDHLPGWPAHRVGRTPWQPDVRKYYMSLSMDIGIGPLAPTPFNAGKSALRAIEYAALGIPCILSAGPAYDGWVDDGNTGLLIPWRDGAWEDALSFLARDPDLRARMGAAAREKAAAWTTEANVARWVDAWNSAERRWVAR